MTNTKAKRIAANLLRIVSTTMRKSHDDLVAIPKALKEDEDITQSIESFMKRLGEIEVAINKEAIEYVKANVTTEELIEVAINHNINSFMNTFSKQLIQAKLAGVDATKVFDGADEAATKMLNECDEETETEGKTVNA